MILPFKKNLFYYFSIFINICVVIYVTLYYFRWYKPLKAPIIPYPDIHTSTDRVNKINVTNNDNNNDTTNKNYYYNYNDSDICNDFFAIILKESCKESFKSFTSRYEFINKQMLSMNSHLTIYSSYSDTIKCESLYIKKYSNIHVEYFNSHELLKESEDIDDEVIDIIIKNWPKNKYTRISDLLRLILALKTKKSYIDLDIIFVPTLIKNHNNNDEKNQFVINKSDYMKSYVGVSVFQDEKNALEITNAAFCLPPIILRRMISFINQRIIKGNRNSKSYFYTELGPSLFHKILFNRQPSVTLYSQNNPAISDITRIVSDSIIYNHKQLHLSGWVRKGNSHYNYNELADIILKKIYKAKMNQLIMIQKNF